jgi:hypothetical protein
MMRKLLVLCAGAAVALAAGMKPPSGAGWKPLLDGKGLAGWHGYPGAANAWFTASSVRSEDAKLSAAAEPGAIIVNGPAGKTTNLVTAEKFADMELYVEFMVSKGSNSGIYLHGLYEIQVFDSFGSTAPGKTSDNGGIYHRWIDNKPVGGSAPRVNASRPPGEWQSFQIWFRGPRFDASGNKTQNAKFLRVEHNGKLVQENVECEGPTRAHMPIPEAAANPLMLQGDHGPVAYRNLYWRPLRQ